MADIIAGATIGIMDMIRAAQSSRALRLAFWARESQVPRATATAIRATATATAIRAMAMATAMATAGAGEPARVFRHIQAKCGGVILSRRHTARNVAARSGMARCHLFSIQVGSWFRAAGRSLSMLRTYRD